MDVEMEAIPPSPGSRLRSSNKRKVTLPPKEEWPPIVKLPIKGLMEEGKLSTPIRSKNPQRTQQDALMEKMEAFLEK